MNSLLETLQGVLAYRVGETLVQFLWEGAAIAAVLRLVLTAQKSAQPRIRHTTACVGLLVMTFAPILTFLYITSASSDVSSSDAHAPVLAGSAERTPSTALPIHIIGTRNWLPLIAWVWIGVVAILALRLALGWRRARQWAVRGSRPVQVTWLDRWNLLCNRLNLSAPVSFLESSSAPIPMTLGWLRPVVVIPVSMIASMPPAQVDAIIAHELAHIARNDYLINLIQRAVETLLFYHPAVWWISDRIRMERELSCDDLAIAAIEDRNALASALLTLAENTSQRPFFALAADSSPLSTRVRRLLGASAENPTPTHAVKTVMAMILAAGFVAAGIWLWPAIAAPPLFQGVAKVIPLIPASPGPLATEIEIMRSERTLSDVIRDLGLCKTWGETNAPMGRGEAFVRLCSRVSIRQIPNTEIVEIRAADENPKIAADIANSICDHYQQTGRDRHFMNAEIRAKRLEDAVKTKEREFLEAAEVYEKLKHALWTGSTNTADAARLDFAQHKMEISRQVLDSLIMDRSKTETDGSLAYSDSQVIEMASPATKPSRWRGDRN